MGDYIDAARKAAPTSPETVFGPEFVEALRILLTVLAPMAPHVSSEMWQAVHSSQHTLRMLEAMGIKYAPGQDVHEQSWPVVDENALKLDDVPLVIQVRGKTKGTVEIPSSLCENPQEVEKFAKESELGKRLLEGKTLTRVIVAPTGRLVNFVIN
eukprot:TRINITY_DN1396_c0_g1_i1.p1 TRINITY_DN1396_c0_g1~~TRINITY_DN1396_c0_g1_i1.p1  ORF type:complete len:155 (-),score=23.74 TRINITY_DN1396_c0_g1_i1:27-491(-)